MKIDKFIIDSLERYSKHGIETGGFLRAVLENDLMLAIGKADSYNRENLHAICIYIYNELPHSIWGSREKVERHLEKNRK